MPRRPSPAVTLPAPTVLLTGFEPFGGDARNPSEEAVLALDGAVVAGHRVAARVLPCVFGLARDRLLHALAETRPAVAICTGLAAGRQGLTVERVAINVDDARIPDNVGARPVDRPVRDGGPAAYFSTLPIKAIARAWREAGLPGAVSQSAGTFVCNHVFYALMDALSSPSAPWSAGRHPTPGAFRGEGTPRGGFVHLPWAEAAAAAGSSLRSQPSGLASPPLTLDDLVTGLTVAIQTAIEVRTDLPESGGAES